LSGTLRIHDFPDPTQHSPRRSATITALQGLYALNSPLLMEQSQALVARLRDECSNDDHARIERVHWLLFSRKPTKREKQLGLAFLGDSDGEERTKKWKRYAHALLASNEFLFVD
ncbi:MAG: DUF1553 domain-containing protein, partial [Planctomycetales bacterium]